MYTLYKKKPKNNNIFLQSNNLQITVSKYEIIKHVEWTSYT